MKIANFTHKDLDGIGCPILLKTCCDDLYIKYCGYNDIDDKVNEFIDSGKWKAYDYIFITDISVKEETAEKINSIVELRDKTTLLDHHPTAVGLNVFEWCHVHPQDPHNEGRKSSGTYLLWMWLIYNEFIDGNHAAHFVEMVRRYDTWEWKDVYNDENPYKLNMLFGLKGFKDFFNDTVAMLKDNGDFEFTSIDNMFINKELERIKRDVDKHMKNVFFTTVGNKLLAICFAENYMNDLAHAICQAYPTAHAAVIIDMNGKTVSYRTEKENIDLGEFAKQYGGGGHPKAAGSQIALDIYYNIIEKYFIKE